MAEHGEPFTRKARAWLEQRPTYVLLKRAALEWLEDNAPRLGAALAFYTIFSLAPLMILVVAIAGAVFGSGVAADQVTRTLASLIGPESAEAIRSAMEAANRPDRGLAASLVGVFLLLVGATTVLAQLQDALNTVWDVEPDPGSMVRGLIKERLLSLAMVLGIGFLLLVSLLASAALSALTEYVGQGVPGWRPALVVANWVASFALATVLFAMIFKVLPDARVEWRHVWGGAAVTALLFVVGKEVIGIYLGRSTLASIYGAAGSFVVILLWVYFSALILFFGAELTQVYATRNGHPIRPEAHAHRAGRKPPAPGSADA